MLRARRADREHKGDYSPDPGPSFVDSEQKGGHVPAPGPSLTRQQRGFKKQKLSGLEPSTYWIGGFHPDHLTYFGCKRMKYNVIIYIVQQPDL